MAGGTGARAQGNPRLCHRQRDVPHPLCLTPVCLALLPWSSRPLSGAWVRAGRWAGAWGNLNKAQELSLQCQFACPPNHLLCPFLFLCLSHFFRLHLSPPFSLSLGPFPLSPKTHIFVEWPPSHTHTLACAGPHLLPVPAAHIPAQNPRHPAPGVSHPRPWPGFPSHRTSASSPWGAALATGMGGVERALLSSLCREAGWMNSDAPSHHPSK